MMITPNKLVLLAAIACSSWCTEAWLSSLPLHLSRKLPTSSLKSQEEDLTNEVVSKFNIMKDEMNRQDQQALDVLQDISQSFRKLSSQPLQVREQVPVPQPPPSYAQAASPPPPPPPQMMPKPMPYQTSSPPQPVQVTQPAFVPPPAPAVVVAPPAPAVVAPVVPPPAPIYAQSTPPPKAMEPATTYNPMSATISGPSGIDVLPGRGYTGGRIVKRQYDPAQQEQMKLVLKQAFGHKEIAPPNPPSVNERLHPTINYFSDGQYEDAHGTRNEYRPDQGSPPSYTMVTPRYW